MTKPILYHCQGARSLRCLWAAEEAGFDLDLKMLPFPPRFFAPEFKEINPLGTIPAWIENGEMMTESGAICQRIAMGTSLEVLPGEPGYFAYLNWLHRSDATLTFPQTIVLRYTRLEPKERRLPQAVEDYKGFFLGRAKSIEAALADGREFLAADRFTVADICVAYALYLSRTLKLDDELGPLCQEWLAKMVAREGFMRAVEREKEGPVSGL
jgi:glutathione S-transferase